MCCGKSAKVTLAIGIGIALGWAVLIGSGAVLGWMDSDDVALNVAMAVATSSGLVAVSQSGRRTASRRESDRTI